MDATERKTAYPGEVDRPAVEERDGVWHVRSLPLVREVLRRGAEAHQAGFAVEAVRSSGMLRRFPVLYLDGEAHKAQRTKLARYFAPATVTKRYLELMEGRADRLLAALDGGSEVDLSEITLHYSAQVAAQVIGLTESDQERMASRLVSFFDQPEGLLSDDLPTGWQRLRTAPLAVPGLLKIARFYALDVRPAIRARRAEPQQDVISHLLAEGYSDLEIVMECVTYGAAGMVTTREFLQVVTWHLMERPELRARFLHGSAQERSAILDEVLRLEPVVGHLYRRTATELVLTEREGCPDAVEHRVPAGARLDLNVRSANADPDVVVPDPQRLCPGRELPAGVRPEGMSFGDGPHRCPGNALAMAESEIFLTRLLARDLELVGAPTVGWEEIIAGYAIRGLRLRDRGGAWVPPADPTADREHD